MKAYDYLSYKEYKEEQAKPALAGACFHGECWYKCPWCNKPFEFWDTQYERGFTKVKDKTYRHKQCGGLVTIA